jgi:sulfur relay (sulfurtransferase) DsrC/TusE family protein
MKARSLECRQPTPLNQVEIFRKKQRGWIDEKTLVVTKEQQATLSKEHFNVVQEIGKKLYEGK